MAKVITTELQHSGASSANITLAADGSVTLPANTIDEAKLKVSNSPTNGQFLSAQSGNTGGLTWAAAGGGKILQVVSGIYSTQTGTTNSSYTDSGLTLNITPASGTKVLVMVSIGAYTYRSSLDSTRGLYNIMRDTTQITEWVHGIDADTDDSSVSAQAWTAVTRTHLDTHGADGSTAVTYKVQMKKDEGTGIYMSWNNYPSSIILMEVDS